MKFTLRMTGSQYAALHSHLFPGDGNEAVAIALCGRRNGKSHHILMVHRIVPIPYSECPTRSPVSITWKTDLIETVLEEARAKGMAILKIHSHPNDYPRFSNIDDNADRELFSSIYAWLDDGLPHMSAVQLSNWKIFARVVTRDGTFKPVDLVSAAGDDLHFWYSGEPGRSGNLNQFNKKNCQFFGDETYARMQSLTIGVIGCSGTGSPLIEQLARLGVGRIVLIDPDYVEEKNLNRILNSTRDDAVNKRMKVVVISDAIQRMDLGVTATPISESIINGDVLRTIAECDVVFGCMDSAEGRYYLNRLAVFYSIPYFDLGVRLDADGRGGVSNVSGCVHYVQPDGSSLIGRGMVSMEAVAAEGLARKNPAEYERRKKESYIRNVNVERPAVITINMQVASTAANEFIARLHPYRRLKNSASAIHTIDFRENDHVYESDGNPCLLLAAYAGRGDCIPFLDSPEPEIQ